MRVYYWSLSVGLYQPWTRTESNPREVINPFYFALSVYNQIYSYDIDSKDEELHDGNIYFSRDRTGK